MSRPWFIVGTVLYVFLAAVFFPFVVHAPLEFVFSSDAVGYSKGAINLLHQGFYTFDGIHPFLDREPVMSFFLAPLYALFGIENPYALIVVQSVMYFAAAWAFCQQAAHRYGSRAAGIAFVLLLTSGSVFHSIFSAYRECLVLSLFLCFGALFLSSQRRSSWLKTVGMGLSIGLVILAYYSFVFLPFFLLPVWFLSGRSWRETVAVFLLCFVPAAAWAFRNSTYDGRFRVIDNRRTAVMWFVRGEQAERLHGLEPFWCLWSEYVTRNWDGRSDACSYNGLMHQRWPDGFDLTADYADVAKAGQAKILAHFPSYLNGSLYEILELHLPYVGGGWSRIFNLYAAATTALLFAGFFAALGSLVKRENLLWTAIIGYNTLVFILTDATPRYMLPTFFCYALFAAIGYDWLLRRIRRAQP